MSNKGTTRGKPRHHPLSGDGAVRDIDVEGLSVAFADAYGFQPSAVFLDTVLSALRHAIVDVDTPPKTPTKREREALSSTAKRLSENLSKLPSSETLLQEIAFCNPSDPLSVDDLYRWLVGLQQPEYFFVSKSPSQSYRSVIRRLAQECTSASAQVSKAENGRFLRFLNNL